MAKVRVLKISDHYSVILKEDGKRETLSEGKPWLSLNPDTLAWDLVDYILKKENDHLPSDGEMA